MEHTFGSLGVETRGKVGNSIVIAPDDPFTHMGISSSCFPTITIPSEEVPLNPPLTFATRILHAVTTYLSINAESLKRWWIAIAEPPLPLKREDRESIVHAGKLLRLKGVTFHSANDTISAATTIRNPLIVHVGTNHTVVATIHRIAIVGIGIHQVDERLASALNKNPDNKHLTPETISYIRRICSVCTDDDAQTATVKAAGNVIQVGTERARAWDVLFSEDGKYR